MSSNSNNVLWRRRKKMEKIGSRGSENIANLNLTHPCSPFLTLPHSSSLFLTLPHSSSLLLTLQYLSTDFTSSSFSSPLRLFISSFSSSEMESSHPSHSALLRFERVTVWYYLARWRVIIGSLLFLFVGFLLVLELSLVSHEEEVVERLNLEARGITSDRLG
jgi:hypothetical protein